MSQGVASLLYWNARIIDTGSDIRTLIPQVCYHFYI